jgi:methionyl-tRNA synthetase|tara:strand:- start:726 stop:2258 length:1533 start_codon:yes stop_codon:yes gene_type:complete
MTNPFYISTAISYTNGPPHIGHAYEVIAADAIARFKRLDGYDVFFLTGTDEHGLKVQKKAKEMGIDPKKYVDEISKEFIKLSISLDCSNNDFIRTTDERHIKNVHSIWKILFDKGDIYLDQYSGWYSITDEAFYNEEELIKTESNSFLSPNGNPVEWVDEESYFFKLSKYENNLLELYEKNEEFIFPNSRMNEIKNFVKSGLKDISISRKNISWGIPVKENTDHSIYVWLDALTNYISALDWCDNNELFKRFWPADVHLIGKDITRFHAVYWPAFLLSAGIKLPKMIFSHGFLLNKGEKISKSKGNTVDPFELIDLYGVDQLRFYLLSTTPFGNDGNYSHELITNHSNALLSNDLGNLSQRCLKMVYSKCNGKIPNKSNLISIDKSLLDNAYKLHDHSLEFMSKYQIHSYLNSIFDVITATNKYFSDQKPWELDKENPERMSTVLWVTCEVLRVVSILLQPVLIEGSKKLLDFLNVDLKKRSFNHLTSEFSLTSGVDINEPNVIFPKIDL